MYAIRSYYVHLKGQTKPMHLPEDVLLNKINVGKRVVVIGAGLVGCEVAYKLWSEGKSVTLIEMQDDILVDTSVVYP